MNDLSIFTVQSQWHGHPLLYRRRWYLCYHLEALIGWRRRTLAPNWSCWYGIGFGGDWGRRRWKIWEIGSGEETWKMEEESKVLSFRFRSEEWKWKTRDSLSDRIGGWKQINRGRRYSNSSDLFLLHVSEPIRLNITFYPAHNFSSVWSYDACPNRTENHSI